MRRVTKRSKKFIAVFVPPEVQGGGSLFSLSRGGRDDLIHENLHLQKGTKIKERKKANQHRPFLQATDTACSGSNRINYFLETPA